MGTADTDTTTSHCAVDAGELAVHTRGTGQPLLMIAGGLGSCDSYRALARRLSSYFTVITYDRRGHFNSTDHSDGPITIARQAIDAKTVLNHLGFASSLVFGSSAGAVIGLELVARFPESTIELIAHEPPAVRLLPDSDDWLYFAEQQVTANRSGDVIGAFTQFVGSLAGAELPELRAVRLPNEHEWSFLFSREITGFYEYLPDLEALRASNVPIVPAGGVESRGYYHYRPAEALAYELGVSFVEMPGAHLAPQRNPGQFAEKLRGLLVTTA